MEYVIAVTLLAAFVVAAIGALWLSHPTRKGLEKFITRATDYYNVKQAERLYKRALEKREERDQFQEQIDKE